MTDNLSTKIENDVKAELKKPFWTSFMEAVQSPYEYITHWTSKSPLLTILAVVFLLQPIISTCIDVVHTWKQIANPKERPISKEEFDLLNQRVAFLQGVVVAHMNQDAVLNRASGTELKPLADTQKQLDSLSKKLDTAYINKAKK